MGWEVMQMSLKWKRQHDRWREFLLDFQVQTHQCLPFLSEEKLSAYNSLQAP